MEEEGGGGGVKLIKKAAYTLTLLQISHIPLSDLLPIIMYTHLKPYSAPEEKGI